MKNDDACLSSVVTRYELLLYFEDKTVSKL